MIPKPLSVLCLLAIAFSACKQAMPPAAVINTPELRKADSLFDRNPDSAFYYYTQIATTAKDSLLVARGYNGMGELQSDAGDYFDSQQSLLTSLGYLHEENPLHRGCLAANYNELGTTSRHLGNEEAAIRYFDKAFDFTDKAEVKATIRNNQGNLYQKEKQYSNAIRKYHEAMSFISPDGKTYARIVTNLAFTKWLMQPAFDPVPDFNQALRIRLAQKDLWGENASYGHLSDYYLVSRPDSSLKYTRLMYNVANRINSPDDRLEALQKLIRLGPPESAKSYFAIYQRLKDSLQTAHSKASNRFALIRYESEKNRLDFLRYQKLEADARYRLLTQRVLSYSLIALVVALGFAIWRWNKKRKQQQEQETRAVVRETQRKASKQVHDGLSADAYRLMKSMQQDPMPPQEQLLEAIDSIYQRARNLSYEMTIDGHFNDYLFTLSKSFSSDDTKVLLFGNSEQFWQRVDSAYRSELRYILQEFMINMQKHSQAKNVTIKFEERSDLGFISYWDDGCGFPSDMQQGNGLKNAETRIIAIQGSIKFDSSPGTGLQIQITFPLTKSASYV